MGLPAELAFGMKATKDIAVNDQEDDNESILACGLGGAGCADFRRDGGAAGLFRFERCRAL
jgi:hypothetical protein